MTTRSVVMRAPIVILMILATLRGADCNPIMSVIGKVADCFRGAPESHSLLSSLRSEFNVDSAKLKKITEHMLHEMDDGLETAGASSLLMIPTHLTQVPSGKETGSYLALDLGGTNFRVLKVTLKGGGEYTIEQSKHKVSEALMTGPGDALFDFIADKVGEMAPESKGGASPLSLGFTFSFPVHQTSIDSGRLIQWTKGFSCDGVEGEDVVGLLHKAFARKGLAVKVAALVNDTPGTMFAGAYKNPSVAAGLILGTGTNLCYIEKLRRVTKILARPFNNKPSVATWYPPPYASPSAGHIINTEWGNFDSRGGATVLPSTRYDSALDASSVNPRTHLYEKMISGMYLGEVTRLACADLIARGLLLHSASPKETTGVNGFAAAWGFSTETMAAIEACDSVEGVRKVLGGVGVSEASDEDCRILQGICRVVSTRAARLSAAGLAAVALRLGRPECLVAVDGSVFEKYPRFKTRIEAALREILPSNRRLRFLPASDGSGVGAALAAAAVVGA